MHIELPADHRYVSVDREMIVAVCEARFPSPAVARVTPLDGGRYNSTFRLEFAVEAPLVLRIAPAEPDQRPSELHLLRNEVAGIPLLSVVAELMPATLVADFSHTIIPRDYVVQSWLPGTPASGVARSWGSDARARLWRDLGAILRRIHSQTSPVFGRVIGPTHSTWPQALAGTLGLMADGCEALGLAADDLRVIAAAATDDPALAAIRTARLLHGDLGPGNAMVDPDNPARGVIGLFDCDRLWWGDPRADVTFAYLERLDLELRQAFWDGYGPLPEPDPRRELFYLARTLGEARLQHVRLGLTPQLRKTYDLMHGIVEQLGR